MEIQGKVEGIEDYIVKGKVEAQAIRVRVPHFQFLPGQYCMLSEEGFRLRSDPSKLKWTSYSIASSPLEEGILEFVYTVKYKGGFTQHLAENLQIGGALGIRGPYGRFVLEENGKAKTFVAAGAGIAPIMSMLRSLHAHGRNARLFYGFRTGGHFLYRKELEGMPGLELHTIISREDPSWKGERGHVQKLLENAAFRPGKEEAYLCGSPDMVREVRSLLLGKGLPEGDIRSEQW